MWLWLVAPTAWSHELDIELDPVHHEIAAGGVVLDSAWVQTLGDGSRTPPMGCIGGQGFEVDHLLRVGGDGHFCAGSGSLMGYGGVQAGAWFGFGPVAFSPYIGGGIGWRGLEEPTDGALFAYARPTLAFLVMFGVVGVELGGYTTVGGELATWSSDATPPTPQGLWWSGGQVSVVFGELWPHLGDDEDEDLALALPGGPPPRAEVTVEEPEPADPVRAAVDDLVGELEKLEDSDAVRKALDDASRALRDAADALAPEPEEPAPTSEAPGDPSDDEAAE